MFVFDDVGVVSTFRVPKTCCLPISTKRKKNTFQRFQRGIVFWRVQVPDFFPSFLQTFFSPLSCRSIPWRPNFIGNPGRWPPCSELCVSRSLRVWNRTAWITFKSSWNIFSRRLPKLPLRWGNISVEVNVFWLFFLLKWRKALVMWCGVIWWRCVHFALSMFFFLGNRNEQILFAKRWTYRCDPSSLLLSVDGLLAVGWWVAYLNPKLWTPKHDQTVTFCRERAKTTRNFRRSR